jgi:glycerol uptake facilitator protein
MRSGLTSRLAAELIGAFILVFFGAAAGSFAGGDLVRVALAHAFALALAVWIFGPISGAHVNPAVTIALTVRGRLPWVDAGLYIIAQLVGGFLAALVVWAAGGRTAIDNGLGATHVGRGFSTVGALVAEIVGTFLLVSAVYVLAVGERVPFGTAGLGIGVALGASILAVGSISGASLNPARTLGPELVLGLGGGATQWSTIWVYLLGPAVGGLLAVFVHDFAVQRPAVVQR